MPAAPGLGQPTGFVSEKIGTNWNAAVGLAFSKDGNRMYVWEKAGKVWIIENGQKLPTPLLDISEEVGDWRDHGMLGFALDPNFESNGYYYVLYVVDRHHLLHFGKSTYSSSANEYSNATIGRLARYTARSGDNRKTTDMTSRKLLIGETISQGIPILYLGHGVGSLVFGEDGSLLVSVGDAASAGYVDTGYDPLNPNDTYIPQAIKDGIITEKDNIGAYRAQQVECINGKILRLDPATGNGLPSNPFFNSSAPRSAASRVWALGLRNPFRFTVRPGSGSSSFPGVLYIGDVGWHVWEEVSVATKSGLNFGWPIYEGLEPHEWYYHKQVPNKHAAPNPLYGQGSCTQQYLYYGNMLVQPKRTLAPYFGNPCDYSKPLPGTYKLFVHTRPAFEWKHENRGGGSRAGTFSGEDAAVALIGSSASPVSGPQFSGSSATGGIWYTGNDFPAQYQNTYFFGDYAAGWIRNSTFDAANQAKSISNFKDKDAFVVALATNPVTGGLYYINYATEVIRVSYKAGNLPPSAVAAADKLSGGSPLTVKFSSSGSADPEGQALKYEWNFGDGTPVTTETNPSHTFSSSTVKSFTVTLKVTDAGGLSATASLTIALNNTAPVVTITSPAKGTLYPLTEQKVYTLTATVTDKEHSGTQLQYNWQTILHHNQHTHPEPIDNKPSTTTTISPIGCDGETYFYRIVLTVKDAAGLSGSDYVDLYPDCGGNVYKAVAITAPTEGQTFSAGASIALKVTFNDLSRAWAKVVYYQNGNRITETTTSPFGSTWKDVPGGNYSLSAKATDALGHEVEATAVRISVTGGPNNSGSITREYWANAHGSTVATIPLSNTPTSVTELPSFEAPAYTGDNYGQRVRGYITAPATGGYTFWLAADDVAELWLSTSEDPARKTRIALVERWTGQNEWGKYPGQQSGKVMLEAGKRYYIEALHKEQGGGDNLSVGWQLPAGTMERPVPGNRLASYLKPPIYEYGKITREYWANAHGSTVATIPLGNTPTSVTELPSFETPAYAGDNYGQRVRGYITAPATGGYTFWLAADDVAELWLSTSEDPARKTRIALVERWTGQNEWGKYPGQQSGKVTLEAGKRYYIEALHKEQGGGDNLSVGWQLPAGTMERPVPGNRLSPFKGTSQFVSSNLIVSEATLAETTLIYPNPFSDQITISLPDSAGEIEHLMLYDLAGRVVFQNTGKITFTNSEVTLTLNSAKLGSGFYILRLQMENRKANVFKVQKL
ncbi:PA14 domain-containing protein [Pontibacter qinzhouensis]|uniref:PA14 domain-containing protein n=1 Tax=Pontibacter qinzhouensis TaxID=2603253 RepID=UPI00165047CF|nr:PA14 domain-containing protein [Pontibacter qinzhouensis]